MDLKGTVYVILKEVFAKNERGLNAIIFRRIRIVNMNIFDFVFLNNFRWRWIFEHSLKI